MRAIICILFLFPFISYGQQYPQGYFRNPVDIPILLAGNFGECRPGHFHSGLDIKTQGRENMPVRAAADGYVSRIKTDKGGFGHALYITHPNGYTTLYAHLNDFAPAMQKYLKQQQYEKKRWDVDITLPPTKFPVKKGEQIAWSGNTGGSSAPHLHFEIRDTKTEHPLNPQLFGFDIKDTIAPVVKEVVFYNLDGSIYNDIVPLVIPLRKDNNKYVLKAGCDGPVCDDTVHYNSRAAGIGINTDDVMDNSGNTISFLTAKLYMNDTLQSEIRLDNIGYEETRYINAYVDYRTKKEQGKWIQCFFKLPGNRLGNIYTFLNSNKGVIRLPYFKKNEIKIVLTDNSNNSSVVSFFIADDGIYTSGYGDYGDEWAETHKFFKANQTNKFNNTNISFFLDDKQLYDDVVFTSETTNDVKSYSAKFKIGENWIPIHHYFDLKIKPNKNISTELKNKVVMKYSDGKDEDGRAATAIDSGWYSAKVRAFGTYWLDIDTTAPVIASMQRKSSNLSKARQIAFTVKDDMTSVKTFSGYLDGKWICFEQHGDDFFYKFDEHCPKGKHKLVFKAADENGNEATEQLNFIR